MNLLNRCHETATVPPLSPHHSPEHRVKLLAVRWSKTHRPTLEYRHASGARVRHRLALRGAVTIIEAMAALGVSSANRLYRMKRRGALRTVRVKGTTMVRVAELKRVRRQLRGAA